MYMYPVSVVPVCSEIRSFLQIAFAVMGGGVVLWNRCMVLISLTLFAVLLLVDASAGASGVFFDIPRHSRRVLPSSTQNGGLFACGCFAGTIILKVRDVTLQHHKATFDITLLLRD